VRTATVASMPECDEVDVQIDPKDIEMSTLGRHVDPEVLADR
jgi:protein subunit release factor A